MSASRASAFQDPYQSPDSTTPPQPHIQGAAPRGTAAWRSVPQGAAMQSSATRSSTRQGAPMQGFEPQGSAAQGFRQGFASPSPQPQSQYIQPTMAPHYAQQSAPVHAPYNPAAWAYQQQNQTATPGKRTTGQPRPKSFIRSRKFWIILASIIAAVAIIGVLIWWFIFTPHGAKTPEEALDRTVEHINGGNTFALVKDISPLEMQYLLSAINTADATLSDQWDAQAKDEATKLFKEMGKYRELKLSDVEYTKHELNEDIISFTITGGTLHTHTTDPDKYADTFGEFLRSSKKTVQPIINNTRSTLCSRHSEMAEEGCDAIAEIDAEVNEELEGELIPPNPEETADIGSIVRTPSYGEAPNVSALNITAVREKGGWYISPALSLVLSLAAADGQDISQMSVSIPEGGQFASPEAAAESSLQAVIKQDSKQFTSTLPLVERRVITVAMAAYNLPYKDIDNFADDLSDDIGLQWSLKNLEWKEIPYAGHQRAVLTAALFDASVTDPSTNTLRGSLNDSALSLDINDYVTHINLNNFDVSNIQTPEFPLLGISSVKENGGWYSSIGMTAIDSGAAILDGNNTDTALDTASSFLEELEEAYKAALAQRGY